MLKRFLVLILSIIILFSFVSCNKEDAKVKEEEPLEITWWISRGEDSTYYMSYEDNPVIKYLESLEWNGRKVKFKFLVPVSGAERDNFNTLLMTEEYAMLMDMSYCTSTPTELLQDDVIWDLTPYLDECLPSYKKIIDENPDLAPMLYSPVDGDKRILSLYSMSAEVTGNFMGLNYRRDWVAKYGKNPFTGEAFTYGYTDPADYNTYYDDVVFPNGTGDPIYVSDWEWMFSIFEEAIKDLGITDGYCVSITYKGYAESGGFFDSAFGGGCPLWFRNPEGDADFGGTSEAMRTYIEMMNNWYNKGWLDKNFADHTSDQIYSIDSAKINSGKVGAFVGRRGNSGGQMDSGDKFTEGIMIYGARPAINDVYGSDSVKNKEPYSLYQYSKLRANLCVTKKVKEEDLKTVLALLDFFYKEEGGTLTSLGLTKEQDELCGDKIYSKYGLDNGALTKTPNGDGTYTYKRDEKLLDDNNLASAMAGKRLTLGYYHKGIVPALNASYSTCALQAMGEWDYYYNTGYIDKSLRAQFTPDEAALYSKIFSNVDTYMSQNIPAFITGAKDVNGKDWDDYKKMLNKYSPQKVTAIFQRVFDSFK